MTDKDKYKLLFKDKTDINIFSKPWWLDATSGEENWDVIISEKDEQVLAAMPYHFVEKRGKISISQSTLTARNGIWIKYPQNQKYSTRISYERKLIRDIIDKLEEKSLRTYSQNFNYSFTNWLPFYWKGFSQTTRYSYVIESNKSIDEIYAEVDATTRNKIKKANKVVSIYEDLSIEKFYEINEMTFKRKNMSMPYSIDFINRLHKACIENKCSKVLYAKDQDENIHAATYIVWDEHSVYYLMGGINPDFKKSKATSLLLWEAIKFANEHGKDFDFEGSMNEGIEKFFSSFGGSQKSYFNIYKNYEITSSNFKEYIYKNSSFIKRLYKKVTGAI